MSDSYRAVYVKMLDDPDYLNLSGLARHLVFVLKLRLGSAGIACVPGLAAVMADSSGYPQNECAAALDELEQAGWIVRERTVVWLKNGLKFEPTMRPRNRNQRMYIQALISKLPKVLLVRQFCEYYATWSLVPWEGLSGGLSGGLSEGLSRVQETGDRIQDTGNKREKHKEYVEATNVAVDQLALLDTENPAGVQKAKEESRVSVQTPVDQVYEFWRTTVPGREEQRLTDPRKKVIRALLNKGYTVTQMQTVIAWAVTDPWLSGTDPASTRDYLDITNILVARAFDDRLFRAEHPNGKRVTAANATHQATLAPNGAEPVVRILSPKGAPK